MAPGTVYEYTIYGRLSQMLRLNQKKKKKAKRERQNAPQLSVLSKWALYM